MPSAVDGMKLCPDCGATKPADAFPISKTKPDGRGTYCKDPCIKRRNEQSRQRKAAGESRKSSAHESSLRKRSMFMGFIEQGYTVADAAELTGVGVPTYRYWREVDPEFRNQIDAIRALRSRENQTWDGSFASFRETFFPQEYPTPPFHIDIVDRLEAAPGLSMSMVLCPPNHGKTTVLEDWICYKLAQDPNHRITVVSKGQQQARKMLGRVQRRMTDKHLSPEYIGRFGPFYVEGQEREGKPWTKDYFTVNKANHDERDYSLQVLGWSGQIYGSRIDTLLLDDIQTRDNLTSVDNMLDKLNLEHISRLDEKQGRIFFVGTRIEVGDIAEKLMDSGRIPSSRLMIYPAINHEGKALWPDRWPVEKLDHDDPEHLGIRQMVKEKAWWCGYQQQPQLSQNATFSDELVEDSLQRGRKIGPAKPGCPVVISIDPGLNPGATAIMALAYSMDAIDVLDAETKSDFSRVEDILILLEEYALRYRPQDVVIETVAFQRALARDERLESLSRKYGFRIHEHNTGRNKLDPVLGVASMAGSFIRREVGIPFQDEVSEKRMEPLIAQLRAWRPNVPTRLITQDLVMALWFAWLFILHKRREMGAPADAWKRDALPWEPTNVSPTRLILPRKASGSRA